ncbi:MAG: GNAT family N-acetyltransferase [Ramlibacter sp.]|nr:GNAT family N-acetyltransferase [Ramlibacter sp.]
MLIVPVIRLATLADAGEIAQMSRSYIEQGLGWSWREGRVLRAIRDPATNVAVMTDLERVIGFGIMQYFEETAHLALFAVDPGHRNRGLGSRLVSWLEQPARIAGIERIRVEARADNSKAIAFYGRLGFVPFKTVSGYYGGIVDAVQLQKRLAAPA